MTAQAVLPLFSGADLDALVAWRSVSGGVVEPVSCRRLLAEATLLAQHLSPLLAPGGGIVNLCADRYHFALGFVAGLLCNAVSLQPASHAYETLAEVAADYPGSLCLRDGDDSVLPSALHDFPLPDLSLAQLDGVTQPPQISVDRVVAILFTSGSTGRPQAQRKTWGKLVANVEAGTQALGWAQTPHSIVATVPAQHSYGFESSFLPALQAASPFWAGKPFYPQDIAAALAAVPRPRCLLTTPFHLAALLDAGIDIPALEGCVSATAPLTPELAARAEAVLGAPLLEIYGSTESGQLASRRPTQETAWTLLAGVCLAETAGQIFASGRHVEGRVPLGDRIEQLADGRFALLGRHADTVNVAGKRTSLAWLNHQISAIPGVRDAAFYLPAGGPGQHVVRLAAFVVAPGLSPQDLLAALRPRIDAVFLPRPLRLLEVLPRNSTGKLTQQALETLYQQALHE
ncbi:AMP-binding protein [Azonexus sp.]|uniref:AMP-binding protein n=1 Tax=Azonexus sp. TaxID=1872668 RepID=UPI0039E6031C